MTMSKDAKYIVFDNGLNDVPVVFPHHIEHSTIAAQLQHWTILSAGYVTFSPDGPSCHGESISLGVKSRTREDTLLIIRELRWRQE